MGLTYLILSTSTLPELYLILIGLTAFYEYLSKTHPVDHSPLQDKAFQNQRWVNEIISKQVWVLIRVFGRTRERCSCLPLARHQILKKFPALTCTPHCLNSFGHWFWIIRYFVLKCVHSSLIGGIPWSQDPSPSCWVWVRVTIKGDSKRASAATAILMFIFIRTEGYRILGPGCCFAGITREAFSCSPCWTGLCTWSDTIAFIWNLIWVAYNWWSCSTWIPIMAAKIRVRLLFWEEV